MLHGISTFSSLTKPPLCAVLSDVERVNTVLAASQVIHLRTGSEAVAAHIPRAMEAFEYLHAPEPSSVAAIRPLLDSLPGVTWRGRRVWPGRVNGSAAG